MTWRAQIGSTDNKEDNDSRAPEFLVWYTKKVDFSSEDLGGEGL